MFGIDDAVAAVSTLADTVVKRIWPDATLVEKARIDQVVAEMQNEYNMVLGQLKINEVEAAHPSMFVAGARPAVMWVGVATMFYSGIGVSLLTWIGSFFGVPPLPLIDPTASTNILYGMLGLGAARTVEKVKGVATSQIIKK
ncbi:holin [Caudoviricetes sp.]|nr:holin [Caudoviricetes sp.]